MGRYLGFLIVAVVIASLGFCYPGVAVDSAYAGENEDITEAGDILQIALPTIAWVSTFFAGGPDGKRWDREGTAQATKAIGGAIATTSVLKVTADKLRPHGKGTLSFPSGHTTAAFAGGGFIDTRYGHTCGIPALLAAAFVGYSRVQADAHFVDDVTAGMSVGLMSNWLFVTPQSQSGNIAVMPMMLKDGAGLQLTLTNGGKAANSSSKTKTLKTSRRRARYEFGFGPAYLKKNEITAPSSTGTTFDLDNFEKISDPTTTAAVGLDIYLDDRNEINVYWAPFEARDRGTFTSPVSFAGQIFPANRPVRSAWVYYDLRAGWRYNLILSNPWNVKLGVGLAYQNIEVDLAMEDQTVAATVEDFVVLPYLHASVGYQIGPRWSAGLSLEGISLSDDTMFDGSIHLDYRISDRWDFSIGYKYCARDMETSELTNKVVYNVPYLSVSFSWLR